MLNRLQAALLSLMASLIILWGLQPVQACVEGLAWGMPLDQVHAHLGEIHQANTTHPERFFARNVMLDRLPVSHAKKAQSDVSGSKELRPASCSNL